MPLTSALWPLEERAAGGGRPGAPLRPPGQRPRDPSGAAMIRQRIRKGFRSRSRMNMMLRCQKRSLIIINPVIMRAIGCLLEMRAHRPACSSRHTAAAAAAPVRRRVLVRAVGESMRFCGGRALAVPDYLYVRDGRRRHLCSTTATSAAPGYTYTTAQRSLPRG